MYFGLVFRPRGALLPRLVCRHGRHTLAPQELLAPGAAPPRGCRCRTVFAPLRSAACLDGLTTARDGSGHAAGEDILLDDRVDAPVAVNHLGDAEVDADGDQRDCLILRQLLG